MTYPPDAAVDLATTWKYTLTVMVARAEIAPSAAREPIADFEAASSAAISLAVARNSAVGTTPQPNFVSRGPLAGWAMMGDKHVANARARNAKRAIVRGGRVEQRSGSCVRFV